MAQAPDPAAAHATWTGPRPDIERIDVSAALQAVLDQVLRGSGRLLILHGPPGADAGTLARRFVAEANRRHRRLRTATADAADPEHPAFRQLAFRFTAAQRAGEALRRSLPAWIGLTPIIGGLLEAIMETVRTLRPKRAAATQPVGSGSTIDQVRLLLSFGGADPRLILLENLDRSDPDELSGAFALVQRLHGTHTLFLATATAAAGQLTPEVRGLLHEAERHGIGGALPVPPLPIESVLDAVEQATGGLVPEAWAAWLGECAPASATELWELLGGLVASGHLVGSERFWRWQAAPPELRMAAAALPVADVAPAERDLLVAAALCGARFRLDELAQRLGCSESAAETRMAPLLRRRLLALADTVEEAGELVDVYVFQPPGAASGWAALAGGTPEVAPPPPA